MEQNLAGDNGRVPLETIVVTWRDGLVATYEDITYSTRDGWLLIYAGSSVLWRFPSNSIRAVGRRHWHPDTVHEP